MLSAAESTGIERVIALRPPLLAMYAVSPRLARSPWRDEMLTIAPCPAARMHEIAARQSHIGAVRLTRRIASHAGVGGDPAGQPDRANVALPRCDLMHARRGTRRDRQHLVTPGRAGQPRAHRVHREQGRPQRDHAFDRGCLLYT